MTNAVFSLSTKFTSAFGYRFNKWLPNSGFKMV